MFWQVKCCREFVDKILYIWYKPYSYLEEKITIERSNEN